MPSHVYKKPDVTRNIVTYKLRGEITLDTINDLVQRVENHLHILRGLEVKGFLISLEDVKQLDESCINLLMESVGSFHVKLKVIAGFCDYSFEIYKTLLPYIKQSSLGLFKSHEIMALAIGSSGVHSYATLLVYVKDLDSRQSIASTLISNNYSVVIANSLQDARTKAKDKGRFERIITHSFFGNLYEKVNVAFVKGVYIYEFRGDLTVDLIKRINLNNFNERLSIGHKVFVFDLGRIYHMDMRAAYILLEMEKLALQKEAQIAIINIDHSKIDNNSLAILEKSKFWIFDTLNELLKHEDIIDLIEIRKNQVSQGLLFNTVKMAAQMIASVIRILELYEFKDIKKFPSKQIRVKNLVKYKADVCSFITFDGDYNGSFVFLFSKKIVEILSKRILEDFKKGDSLDVMSELVNSISGKLKSNLNKREHTIELDLPRSTRLISDFISDTDFDKPTVLMTFQCQGYNFYVALTCPII